VLEVYGQYATSTGPLRRHLAYDAIRAKILSGEFPPGSTLSEAELASLLGISRTPVREALQRLQEDGLATILPRRGALVRILTLPEVREILLVREALEGLAARLAATHISRAMLEGLRAQWQDVLDTLEASTLQALDKQGCNSTPRSSKPPATERWRGCWRPSGDASRVRDRSTFTARARRRSGAPVSSVKSI